MSEFKEIKKMSRNGTSTNYSSKISEFKEVKKIFISGKISATLVIPVEMARRHGLQDHKHVILEEKPEGILIRRLEI